MSELVKRLRSPEVFLMTSGMISPVAEAAADHIEKLEAALQIYSCDCSLASEEEDCELGDWTMLSCGYRARKALEEKDA